MITVTVLHQENHREQRTPSPISSPLCSPLNARPPFGRSTPSPLLSVVLSPPAALPASPGAPPTAAPIGCGRAGRAPGGGGAQHGARGGPSAEPGVGGLRVWGRAQPHRGLPQTHKGILGGGGEQGRFGVPHPARRRWRHAWGRSRKPRWRPGHGCRCGGRRGTGNGPVMSRRGRGYSERLHPPTTVALMEGAGLC